MTHGNAVSSVTVEHEVRDVIDTEVICTCDQRFDAGGVTKSLRLASQHAMDESLAEAHAEEQVDNPAEMQPVSALAARARELGVATRSMLPTVGEALAVAIPSVALGVGFAATIEGQSL